MKNAFLIILFSLVMNPISKAQFNLDGRMAATIMEQDMELFPERLPSVVSLSAIQSNVEFDVYKVVLDYPAVGKIKMLLKGPHEFISNKDHRFQSLMIVSGFFTGEQSIHLIGTVPNRILVGFEYPFSVPDFQNDAGTILQFVRKTPGQIAMALQWLSHQSWSDSQRVSVMGVSLGGIFLPASLNIGQDIGIQVEKSIFVCTGMNLPLILRENLKEYLAEPYLSSMVQALIVPTVLMDPKLHLPFVKGSSLVIQTDHDTVIPKASQEALLSSLQNSKTQVILPGPHINPDQTELIGNVQKTITGKLGN